MLDYMAEVPRVVPDVDFNGYRDFLKEVHGLDQDVYTRELETRGRLVVTYLQAVEFNKQAGFRLKSYFMVPEPQRVQPKSLQQWGDAVVEGNAMLREFLTHDTEGQLLVPTTVGMDDMVPARSRLEIYYASPSTSFRSMCAVMTMGRRRPVSWIALREQRSLIRAVLGLAANHPEEAEVAPVEAGAAGNDDDHQRPGYVLSRRPRRHRPPGQVLPQHPCLRR